MSLKNLPEGKFQRTTLRVYHPGSIFVFSPPTIRKLFIIVNIRCYHFFRRFHQISRFGRVYMCRQGIGARAAVGSSRTLGGYDFRRARVRTARDEGSRARERTTVPISVGRDQGRGWGSLVCGVFYGPWNIYTRACMYVCACACMNILRG